MITSKTNVRLEIDSEVKDLIAALHENVNDNWIKTRELEKDISDKIYEINDMIQTYNNLCNFIEENVEEVNQMLDEHLSTFEDALRDKESALSEKAYEELDEWVSDWKDFSSELKGYLWIRTADEVDEDVFTANNQDSFMELEKHICYNQPLHAISVEDSEEETQE